MAQLVTEEVAGRSEKSESEVYEKIVEEEQEKEIVKSQRKKQAGKVTKKAPQRIERAEVKKGIVEIPEMISVKELAEKTGLSAAVLIGALMKNGILANLNQVIDFDTAVIISSETGVELKKQRSDVNAEDIFKGNLEKLLEEDDKSDLKKRPPWSV